MPTRDNHLFCSGRGAGVGQNFFKVFPTEIRNTHYGRAKHIL